MTIAHVEKFAEFVVKDPVLYTKFGWEKLNEVGFADLPEKEAFMANVLSEGKALGLDFTAEEVLTFLENLYTTSASDELSDLQLEAVAGGKGQSVQNTATQVGQGVVNAGNMIARDMTNFYAPVFKGW